MLTYYPPIKANAEYQLAVDTTHTLYIEESGNPHGIPILFLHGGPGSGTKPDHRRFFDPLAYRIILFDQRGCGRSTPHAELTNNTTQHLVQDIEAIRNYLNIKQWILFGGSWGSTLALVYAQAHPENVLAMILRGIYLADNANTRWLFQEGANKIFPDHWETFLHPIPLNERNNLINAYYQLLTGEDEIAKMTAAKTWSSWEMHCACLTPPTTIIDYYTDLQHTLALARLECHYMLHQCFLRHQQILNNMTKIQHIPGIIVHGRYDIVCPLTNAWQLHRTWPNSQLQIIPDAGHMSSEPGITDALIRATRSMITRFGH